MPMTPISLWGPNTQNGSKDFSTSQLLSRNSAVGDHLSLGKHEKGIINRLAENTGKLAIYFTKDRCKHNGDIVLKLREEQEISQWSPEVSLLTTPVEKKLASEKTNYRE